MLVSLFIYAIQVLKFTTLAEHFIILGDAKLDRKRVQWELFEYGAAPLTHDGIPTKFITTRTPTHFKSFAHRNV